jgi:hypothetical protein
MGVAALVDLGGGVRREGQESEEDEKRAGGTLERRNGMWQRSGEEWSSYGVARGVVLCG